MWHHKLWLAVCLGLLGWPGVAPRAQSPLQPDTPETLGPDGLPIAWQGFDFQDFELLEPAAGPASAPPSPTLAPTLATASQSPTALPPETPPGGGMKSFRIDQLPRVAGGPVGTPVAIPSMPIQAASPSQAVSPAQLGTSEDFGNPNDTTQLAAFGPLPGGGGAAQLWQGYAAGELSNLRPIASPVLNETWRRVLLTAAPPPSGTTQHWLAARAEALWRLNMAEAAWSLWRQVGPQARTQNPQLGLGWAGASVLAGQTAAPCQLARQQAQITDLRLSGPWLPLVAACQALDGQSQALGLSLQVAPPAVRQQAADVFAVLEALGGAQQAAARVALASSTLPFGPMAVGVLVHQPQLITPELLPRLPDVAWRRLRDTPGLPEWLRQTSAQLLAKGTGLPADAQQVVQLVAAPADWRTEPHAVTLARVAGVTPASGTLPNQAFAVTRAALWQNDAKTAALWRPWAGNAPALLLAQQVLAGSIEASTLTVWLNSHNLSTPSGAAAARRGLSVLEALGTPIPPEAWAQVRGATPENVSPSSPNTPVVRIADGADPAWTRVLAAHAQAGQVPATLQLITEGLAGRPAVQAPAGVLGAAVGALKTLGLPPEARRLAVEVLVP